MEDTQYTSICLLAYKRPQQLRQTIKSLKEATSEPYELIINLDGGDKENIDYVTGLVKEDAVSKLIISGGNNRGVGRSFKQCVEVSEGNYIVKMDTDLTFEKGWLTQGIRILNNTPSRAVAFFDYKHYDPNDHRFDARLNYTDYIAVEDFVSSCYIFKREDLTAGDYSTDDGFHQSLKPLAITKTDMIHNHGFGVTKSVYVSGTEDHPVKTKTYENPLIFNK